MPSNQPAKPPYQIAQAFSVPMVIAHHPNGERLNQDLRELFAARATEGDRYRNPEPRVRRNETLFESRFDLFQWPDPCVQQLREFCFYPNSIGPSPSSTATIQSMLKGGICTMPVSHGST